MADSGEGGEGGRSLLCMGKSKNMRKTGGSVGRVREYLPMTLTFELDLDRIKMNYYAKCLRQRSSGSCKSCSDTYTYRHRRTGRSLLGLPWTIKVEGKYRGSATAVHWYSI